MESTPLERFRIALDIFETGVRIVRQNLKRDFPEATEQEIDDRTRPQDVADLRALLPRADAEEIELARTALGLIDSRGFLSPTLDELIEDR